MVGTGVEMGGIKPLSLFFYNLPETFLLNCTLPISPEAHSAGLLRSPKPLTSNSLKDKQNKELPDYPSRNCFCVFFFPLFLKDTFFFMEPHWLLLISKVTRDQQGYPSDWEEFLTYWEAESLCYKSKLILPNTECQNYLLPLENFTKIKHLYWVHLPLRQQRKLKEAILQAAVIHQELKAYPEINRCLEMACTSRSHLIRREGVNLWHFLIFILFT